MDGRGRTISRESAGDSLTVVTPRIGITWGAGRDERGETFDDPDAYVRAIAAAGGEPVLLKNDPNSIDAQVRGLAGIVITGGQDVAPELYGGRRTSSVQPTDSARDAFEMRLAETARERSLPLLGICRGLQIVTVAFGGTLIEDIREQYGDAALSHRRAGVDATERQGIDPAHVVTVEPGSRLAAILETERFPTNTIHHQSARVVPSDLREVAMTPDGVIEALEATFAHPFFLLVQWHPELSPDDVPSRRLFAAFVGAARTID